MLQRGGIGIEGIRIFRHRLGDIFVREGVQAFSGSLALTPLPQRCPGHAVVHLSGPSVHSLTAEIYRALVARRLRLREHGG
jgi:hypothetical protein